MKKRLLAGLMALALMASSFSFTTAAYAAEKENLTNLAVKSETEVTVSKHASGNGPEKLNDGIISDREGTGNYPGPRSRWHTWPNNGEQWAAMTFGSPQEVHEVIWYALVDEGVNPADAYRSIKVQIMQDGAWVDSNVEHGDVVRYTGEYSDSSYSDAYIYTFDFDKAVTTEGIRVVVDSVKYAGATELQVLGVYNIQYGFDLAFDELNEDGILTGVAEVNESDNDRTLYFKLTDANGTVDEQSVTIPAAVDRADIELDLSKMAIGEVKIVASLNSDYSESKTYQVKKTIPDSVIEDIYEEIKTPYEYDVILKPTGVSGDYDSSLIDNPNIFAIPGDEDYVYMTYVGHDGVGYRTGLARSKDMVTWEKVGLILDNGEEGKWDCYNAAGYIVREHEWGQLPTPHINEKGQYCMTYLASDTAGYEAGIKQAGVAFADSIFNEDGTLTQWTRHEEPVLSGSAGYAYEKNIIWKLQAIYNKEDGLYYGFYNAATGPEVMCGAVSEDLINWTRMENNPLLNTDKDANGGTWGSSYNADADVMKIGDYWVMHYFTSTPSRGIVDSFAVSTDLVNWIKSYMTTTARNSTWSSTYSHKPCVVKNNGVVYHYYCAVGNQGRVIAVDTSIDLSVVKTAQAALETDLTARQQAVLQDAYDNLQYELRRTGGSLEEVEAARTELTNVLDNLDSYDTLPYEDVAEDAWYYDVVYYNYVAGYMTGKTETIFAPDDTLTRAELTSILYRINGEPEVAYEAVFSDVSADAWYVSPVLWAYKNGVVNGYAEGDFKPDAAITREQLAVIMHNYAAAKGYEINASAELDAFNDADQVGDWAKPAMQWAVATGVISGKDGVSLDPQGSAARAEAAAIIQRFMENAAK